jgi:hypothetical protein
MPSPTDFLTHGKVTAVLNDTTVVFNPRGSNYELHMKTAGKYDGPVGTPIDAILRATARKVWTVPSGGNFIAPIMGPPKIIQGRVKYVGERQIVVHATASFVIDMPTNEDGIDLARGPIMVGAIVNVTAFPGATLELAGQRAAVAATA